MPQSVLPWTTFAEPSLIEIDVLSSPLTRLPVVPTTYIELMITTSQPAGFVSPVKAVCVVPSMMTG